MTLISHPRRPGRGLLTAAILAMAACQQDPLSFDTDDRPGGEAVTYDLTWTADALRSWRDTTFTGFSKRPTGPFMLTSNEETLAARTFARFNVPDTVRTFGDTLPVATFEDVSFLVSVDTLRSSFEDLPVTVRMFSLLQAFDTDSTTWQEAAPGTPWDTPGGDLGVEIASGSLEAIGDSVVLAPVVAEDSLMRAWQEEDGGAGVAILVEGATTRLQLWNITLRYAPTLEGRERPVPQTQFPDERTFVINPPAPQVGTALRVSGLPSSRAYLEFSVPSMIEGVPLDEGTVNHAELILHPLPTGQPHGAERPFEIRLISLLGDPWTLGAKTPIGGADGPLQTIDPGTMEDGVPVRLELTGPVTTAQLDPNRRIRLGLRAEPDGQTLGFWDFGSVESPVDLRPTLRIVFTPRPGFLTP